MKRWFVALVPCAFASLVSCAGASPAPGGETAAGGASTDGATGGTSGSERPFDVATLLADFVPGSTHEGLPLGVPENYDWQSRATLNGLTLPSPEATHGNFWGEIYLERGATEDPSLRVAVLGARFLVLYEGESAWTEAPSTNALGGGAWAADFHALCDEPLDARVEPDEARSFVPRPGCNAHFWPELPFFPVDRKPLRAALSFAFARLVREDGSAVPADAVSPYLIAVGADYRKPDGSCPTPPESEVPVCTAFGHGKYIRPRSDFRVVAFSSLTTEDLATLPLPAEELFRLPDGSFPE